MALDESHIEQYAQDGYLCPIGVFDEYETTQLRLDLEDLESRVAGDSDREAAIKNNSNWVVPWFDKLARSKPILDCVSSVLGPDILALNVDLFIKEPQTSNFISWHQDLHYWGLDSDDEVTAWLALSAATAESGCMRFVPGSHKSVIEHTDTFAATNMLSRGQQAAIEIDENDAICAELMPGQMSLHHGRLLHASGPNLSKDRRIGIAIRFIKPSVDTAHGSERLGASLVQGEDHSRHFELVDRPTAEFAVKAMANWKRLREIEKKILFAGVDKKIS